MSEHDLRDDDNLPMGRPLNSTPIVIIDKAKYEAMQARIQELEQECQRLREGARYEPVPQSLEYDLITYAIKNGEIEQGYRICRIAPVSQQGEESAHDHT